ncbi:uncharacterized protein E0L32_006722 [Thyridium curvatum]|uniref:Inositol polyphosphate-related phosphatase domain-containing protein n=1 Tax=Thyridium curvatum TaxID=1093900 RepID=A0A507AS67_9PEZI|nr:uncharacterized protein E0L32_006722 [Thyridium curvatum]TPX12842.1 hypothetical protein E0L32_006722 [Thyridium curvatum]
MASTSIAGPEPDATEAKLDELTSSPQSLHRAVHARRAEYIRPHRIRVKVGTWNVAAKPGTDKDLERWFVSGKGIDQRLASIDLSHNPAVIREDSSVALEDDPTAVRLVGGKDIGLYVLGLQEVVDLNAASQYVGRVYADSGAMDKWKLAIEAALPEGYQHIASEQMTGLLLLIYASPEVAPSITNVSTCPVGTGFLGYLGNKGSIATRIVLGETTRLLFLNCHLASGTDSSYVERRCWDVAHIVSRTQFDPVTHPGGVQEEEPEKVGDEDFAFWFGDLNFRLDGLPGDDIRRLLTLHTSGEYGAGQDAKNDSLGGEDPIVLRSSESSDESTDKRSEVSQSTNKSTDEESETLPDPDEFLPDPSDDPASLQATLDSLLPHDQLRRLMHQGKVFQDGWREGKVTFLPSYKYDVGTVGLFDSSEKQRAPSWCDRILYRTRKDKEEYQKRKLEEEEARKKDEEMKARGMEEAGDDDEVLFDYDPDNDGENPTKSSTSLDYDEYDDAEDEEPEEVVTKEGFVDRIRLDIYTSHQRIQSSDHKPIISIFTLDYDAVVPEMKAKVHAEVAKELDRAENEGRPGITIVVDKPDPKANEHGSDQAVYFGDVRYLQKKTTTLTLANTGRVAATFSFVEKPSTEDSDGPNDPQWLTPAFARSDPDAVESDAIDLGKEVTLEPGETVHALLEVWVNELSHVRMLNDGQLKLEDVLVLRVTDGRDHFIPVRAAWVPTCMGRSIDELIRVPDGGIRAFLTSRQDDGAPTGSIPYDLPVRCAAPKELFKLTEAVETLTERVVADAQMLEDCQIPQDKAGWPFADRLNSVDLEQLSAVIEALDEDKHITDAFDPETPALRRLEAVSEALVLFLRGLTDGVVTVPLWTRIEQATLPSLAKAAGDPAAEDDKQTVLDILSSAPNHNIAFVFLTTTLAKIVAELSPLSQADLEATRTPSAAGRGGAVGAALGSIGRRSSSFKASWAALDRRQARERRYAEVFGGLVCRAAGGRPEKSKEAKALEDRQRGVLELFLRRAREEGA